LNEAEPWRCAMTKPILCLPLVLALGLPAASAPKKPSAAAKPAAKKPAVPRPPADPMVLSEGPEVVLVDRLVAEVTTVVLFYRPANADDVDLADTLRKRIDQDRRVRLRLVKVTGPDAPVARQYEVAELPRAFVYDRNKNLLGKAANFTEVGALVQQGLKLARLKWVDEADPNAPEVYRKFGGGMRPVPGIMKTMSLRPEIMEAINDLSRYHFSDGFLDRRTHEMIASYVSAINKCKF
jgi:hypothetical protein